MSTSVRIKPQEIFTSMSKMKSNVIVTTAEPQAFCEKVPQKFPFFTWQKFLMKITK